MVSTPEMKKQCHWKERRRNVDIQIIDVMMEINI